MQSQLENRVYAGFFVRLVAFAIDSLLAAVVAFTVKSPFSLAAKAGITLFNANFIFQYSFLDVLDYLCVAAYFVLLTYFTHTTPGKMAMRLEVVTIDKEWTLVNVIYRETIGRFFSSLLCVGYFAVIVTEKKQGFHDMFCDTYVVYKNMVPKMIQVPVATSPVPTAPPSTPVAPSMPVASSTPVAPSTPVVSPAPVYYPEPVKEVSFSQNTIEQEGLNQTHIVNEQVENQ